MHGERAKFQAVLIRPGRDSGSSGRSEKPQEFQSIVSSGLAGDIMEALQLHQEERLYAAKERQMEASLYERMGRMAEAQLNNACRMEDREPPRRLEDYATDKKRRPSMQAKTLFWNRFVAHIRE